MEKRSQRTRVGVASVTVVAVMALLAAVLVGAAPAGAQTSTSVDIEVSPSGTTEVGEAVTFSATVTPAEAVGFVRFRDGTRPISDYIPVSDGEVEVDLNGFPMGEYTFNAQFSPQNPEEWDFSTSADVAHTVTVGDLPVMECIGANEGIRSILEALVPLRPAGGVVVIETPITSDVPATIPQGLPSPVNFDWSITIPDYLVGIAEEFGAEGFLSLKDVTLAVEASGSASGEWSFPSAYPSSGFIADPYAPIVLTASGMVTGISQGDIEYAMASPRDITVFVPKVGTVPEEIDVVLNCEFTNASAGSTLVEGQVFEPDAPTGVAAVEGPGQATVSWTAPEDDGGAPVTGYVVQATPFGPAVSTSAEVTSIDVIGLNSGSDVAFTVVAENAVGDSPESAPSNAVSIQPPETFVDVPSDHPFFAEISWMAATGLSTGFEDDTYRPNLPLTRQAMSAFIYRLNGSPDGSEPTCTTMPFLDVPIDHPFCGEIAWMADEGISTGFDDDTYRPNAVTTRQAMSAFLYRSANGSTAPPACSSPPFVDVPVDQPFCPQIAWMADVGISTGFEDDTYRPNADLARQAMSAFLYRYTLVVPTTIT